MTSKDIEFGLETAMQLAQTAQDVRYINLIGAVNTRLDQLEARIGMVQDELLAVQAKVQSLRKDLSE